MRGSVWRFPFSRLTQSPLVTRHVRTLRSNVSPDNKETENSKPLKFSTSKASNRNWSFKKSLGSEDSRPLWQVFSVSALISAIMLWTVFRKETKFDEILFRPIDHLNKDSETNETDTARKE
uniref:Protein CCSMST1 n=1 Tax=Leptobrachium leishanense TaxID=445787 RepID=A0A8C5QRK4_9ANUR